MVARLTSDAFEASVMDKPSPALAILHCTAVSESLCVFFTLLSIFAAFVSRKLIRGSDISLERRKMHDAGRETHAS
jgi:hypothetical protein